MQKSKFKYMIFKILALVSILRNIRRIHRSRNSVLENSMLLIAHPDDESMFFSPFLFYNTPNIILCLSNGDFNLQGGKREEEMQRLCKQRGWSLKILGYRDGNEWNVDRIIVDMLDTCIKYNIRNVITFDQNGVSGHKNHISCYKAAKKLNRLLRNQHLKFYCLKSVSAFEKYIYSFGKSTHEIPIYSWFGMQNMLFHNSQLAWFRYLYIFFSNYMYFNEIHEIPE
ncbi:uncharacterized protein VICG_01797 [Vittaforma corneae ATCC 50505]|uniref:N-acetylglucosaminylphosphatidylinositol deacetylase n=1 Tax=Vittaforma corneae (strain ATCC 50505) TaxID=993615 RepID=L2GJY9_VITCO|nr:uncharacterized protein VICG_01797 [Vittaforma corneae ATCC 50505]ELA41198.1 hypothetical protein VICG_01797 [Vittaforma corneae ATCC 50505]